MHRLLTSSEKDNIELALNLGWHLIPYLPDEKKPLLKWGSVSQECLKDMDQVHYRNKFEKCMIGFVISTANILMVDIDLPLPLRPHEAKGLDPSDHKDKVKGQWKSWPKREQHSLIAEIADMASRNGQAPHVQMLSSSQRGWHGYYHCKPRNAKYLTSISTPDECIEIFANWRMAYCHDWHDMDAVINAKPLPYQPIVDYWSRKADILNGYRNLRRQINHIPPPPLIKSQKSNSGYAMDYEKLVEKSPYAQIAKPCRLFVWLVKALQLDDLDGYAEGINDARMNGLSEAKIQKQEQGAKDFARRHPDPQLLRRTAIDNFDPLDM